MENRKSTRPRSSIAPGPLHRVPLRDRLLQDDAQARRHRPRPRHPAGPFGALPAAAILPCGAEAPAAPGAVEAAAAHADAPAGSLFRDKDDGRFDMSDWLLDRHGFLPVPIIVTDPAVGYGGGVALTFFHRPKGSPATRTGADGRPQMIAPNIVGAMGMKTENGSQAYGAGGQLHFREDTWRYKGGVGKADMNLDFYTSGRLLPPRKVAMNLDGLVSFQQVSRRLGEQDLFLSAQWIYMDLEPRPEALADAAYFDDVDFEQVSSGLGMSLEYDNRDNPFTPSRGYLLKGDANFYLPGIGSDVTFQSYRVHGFGYWPVGRRLVVGGRADLRHADGDVPFYRLPYIDLRGVPSARYQDDTTGVLEAELRWNLTARWAGIGFAGAGRGWGARASFGDGATAVGMGLGVRYLIARRLGLYVGADYAWGPEDETVIIQMGSAWR